MRRADNHTERERSVRRLTSDSAQALVDFEELPQAVLNSMAEAGREVLDCYRVLGKTGDNIVGEVLRGQGTFYEWSHYPEGDVYDSETHAQYYYHAHPKDERSGEHGHFHTFLRPKGMPAGITPARAPGFVAPENPNDALSHLVAISMDDQGRAIQLFTTNRWVTGEVWYAAEDVVAMLERFAIDLARPSFLVNKWIGAMIRLFRPQIAGLLRERDRVVAEWQRRHPKSGVFEDRRLEVTSKLDISAEEHMHHVLAALGRAKR